ncbi:glycoside hydrolase family 32 protein [Kerstersia gyiorum]|uniref:glycoside hydrolase family 32 protein n=1 Tax=Kerstersia gyiorum TaxID=206506 RepID=UPI00083986DC|nr:glycoside hydrolase family 32 protein [Kerstersia gyiorum]
MTPAIDLISRRSQRGAAVPDARYRPVIHYSPANGFMNDPNGLILADGIYHLYYQHNPGAPVSGNVHWGHATSRDLIHWQEQALALFPDARGQAFSGAMVWDGANTSGLFPDGQGGMAALFTRAGPGRQVQELAHVQTQSPRLALYKGNPVLDEQSASFRDPKVFWHDPIQRWVMVVAHARRHEIGFYHSTNLRDWRHTGSFGHAGLLGLDYECPDLVELPVEGGSSRWVLFLSINPGAPTGGSTVQYFVGHFDGLGFTAQDQATRLLDAGQDFYALQTFANTPGRVLGMAWMNNWLYCNATPAHPARGAMTLPRELSLRRRDDHWHIVQRLPDLSPWAAEAGQELSWHDATSGTLACQSWSDLHALEITASGRLSPDSRLRIRLTNRQGECLEAGLDNGSYPGFYLDRSNVRGFEHPFWNHKAIIQVLHTPLPHFDCQIVIDQSSIELLGMQGENAATFLHFFKYPPEQLSVQLENGHWQDGKLRIRPIG